MALPSSAHSPSTGADTPTAITPYRLATSDVVVIEPPIETAVRAAIQLRIEPNRGWWQFPLPRMPWQAQLALGVYGAVVGIGVLAIALAAYLGAHR